MKSPQFLMAMFLCSVVAKQRISLADNKVDDYLAGMPDEDIDALADESVREIMKQGPAKLPNKVKVNGFHKPLLKVVTKKPVRTEYVKEVKHKPKSTFSETKVITIDKEVCYCLLFYYM